MEQEKGIGQALDGLHGVDDWAGHGQAGDYAPPAHAQAVGGGHQANTGNAQLARMMKAPSPSPTPAMDERAEGPAVGGLPSARGDGENGRGEAPEAPAVDGLPSARGNGRGETPAVSELPSANGQGNERAEGPAVGGLPSAREDGQNGRGGPADSGLPSARGNERGETPEAPAPALENAPGDLNALLAADKALQSQFDRLVGKALTTARTRWESEKTEAAEQLATEQWQQREREIAVREQALLTRETRAAALSLLGEKGLPVGLIGAVNCTGEAAMLQSLEQVEKAFRAAVDSAVTHKMKGNPPPAGGEGNALQAQLRAAAGLKSL